MIIIIPIITAVVPGICAALPWTGFIKIFIKVDTTTGAGEVVVSANVSAHIKEISSIVTLVGVSTTLASSLDTLAIFIAHSMTGF